MLGQVRSVDSNSGCLMLKLVPPTLYLSLMMRNVCKKSSCKVSFLEKIFWLHCMWNLYLSGKLTLVSWASSVLFIYFWLHWVCIALCRLSVVGDEWGLLSSCSARASYCGGFSCCGAQALEHVGFSSCSAWAQ